MAPWPKVFFNEVYVILSLLNNLYEICMNPYSTTFWGVPKTCFHSICHGNQHLMYKKCTIYENRLVWWC